MERGRPQSKEQAHHPVPMLEVLRRVRGPGSEGKTMKRMIQQAIMDVAKLPRYETISSAIDDDSVAESVAQMLQDYDEGLTIAENSLRAAATALGIKIQEN